MDYIKHRFEFSFSDKNQEEVDMEVEDVNNKAEAYEKARKRYCKKHSITITEFENKFSNSRTKHFVSYKNKPWGDSDDLIDDLENMDGINSANFLPHTNPAIPPEILLSTSKDNSKIKKCVENYYPPLEVDARNGSVVVRLAKP